MHGLPCLVQRLPAGRLARHRHADAYAAVVLAGSHTQAGDGGRRRLAAGDVAVQASFAAHVNHVSTAGVRLLNLPIAGLAEGFHRIADLDTLARMAERDPLAAAAWLRAHAEPLPAGGGDWPDLLAAALAAEPGTRLSAWARSHGLAAETVSRGFAQAFGVSPRRFRSDALARRALHRCLQVPSSLALLALDAGYADQSHMTHAITALTGRPPGAWRRTSSGDKTACDAPATIGG